MKSTITVIKNIIRDEVPYVTLTSPRGIETMRGAWPCVCVTKMDDRIRKGIRTLSAAIDIYARDDEGAEQAAMLIDAAMSARGFWRVASREKPEALACSLRMVYAWLEAARRHDPQMVYRSGPFAVTMYPDDKLDPVFGMVSAQGLYPLKFVANDSDALKCFESLRKFEGALPRELTLRGVIRRDIDEAKRLLSLTFSPLRLGELIVCKKRLVCQVVQTPDFFEEDGVFFEVKLRASQPFFEDADESRPRKLSGFIGGVKFPVEVSEVFEFGTKRGDGSYLVVNGGDVPVGIRVRIKARGDVKNPSITNVKTGETMRFDFTLRDGEELEVVTVKNHKSATIKLNGASSDAMKHIDPTSAFVRLMPGENFIMVGAESGAPQIDAETTFRRRYISI